MAGEKNIIHPTAIVGPHVKLGEGNYIGPYCVFTGRVEIGDHNRFFAQVAVGFPPQHRSYTGSLDGAEQAGVITIGSGNVFREFVSIHQPYAHRTVIGSDCYLMTQAHVPHDATLEDGVTMANNVQIGGHSVLMKGCNLGLSAVLHQFTVVGSYVMLGMGSVVTKDLLPCGKYSGPGPKRVGANVIGLERMGFSAGQIEKVVRWFERCAGEEPAEIDDAVLAVEVERYQAYRRTVHS